MLSKLVSNCSTKEQLVTKGVPELSLSEQEQLIKMFKRYYPTTDMSYIKDRVQVDCGFDLLLIKQEEQVQGVSYYHIGQQETPFHKKPIPVVFFGQALKREGYKGDLIWQSGIRYAAQKIGWGFPLKKTIGIANVVNPRVYQKFQQLYPCSLNESTLISNKELSAFTNHYFQVERGLSFQVEEDMTCNMSRINLEDITEDWERIYKAKDAAVNKLFFEKGILIQKKGRIYKTAKHLVTCGYRSVFQGHKLVVDDKKIAAIQQKINTSTVKLLD